MISGGAFFRSRRQQSEALALDNTVPAIFADREFTAAGGLLSYRAASADAYRLLATIPAGSRGRKTAACRSSWPVELYIDLKTAKALGLNIPNTLIGRADSD